ncbi:MAG: AbgT family transporter, partial [Bacteroidaceae bacterium]|nr:AbgT family transporter [Bacteroidaceae bacterium]
AGYSANKIAQEFVAGAKDIFSAALVIGFAAGIIIVLENGEVIDTMLRAMADSLVAGGREMALATMYGLQTLINIFIPSASAKAAVTIPIMAPFSDMIGVSRQATVLAFQLGDGITNMITPCSGVLIAVLSIAKIPYERWVKFIWKFILLLMVVGLLLLLPTLYFPLPGF